MSAETCQIKDSEEQTIDRFKQHAILMAEHAGINISKEQTEVYADLRFDSCNGSFSDQQLLCLLLNSRQRKKFQTHYPHIHF